MIRHVVMWQVRGETITERRNGSVRVKIAFESLRGQIPGMRNLEVGICLVEDDDMCDVVLISDFDSVSALNDYAVHPLHLAVRDDLTDIRISRHCIDFAIDTN